MGRRSIFVMLGIAMLMGLPHSDAKSSDLEQIRKRGVLRHLGVPYAHFVTGSGDGLDVELLKLFAKHLKVKYQYVKTSWSQAIGDLTGKNVAPKGNAVITRGRVPIRGDVIANGMTILRWREKVVRFSTPTFPTQVWLVARADAPLRPIKPTGNVERDVKLVRQRIRGRKVLGKVQTCLDPSLYNLAALRVKAVLFKGKLNELAPAIINGEAEATLLDVPDALVGLVKWPGKIKVIGPISPPQKMGVAFRASSPNLRAAFNRFFQQCWKNGTYLALVKKYYPAVFDFYASFFRRGRK